MKTATVASVAFKKTWQSKHGPMHTFIVEMDNGDQGEYNSKSEEQTKFVEGQSADYELEDDKYGKKIKPAFVKNEGGFSGGRSSATDKAIRCQVALKAAVELIVHDKIEIKHLEAAADRMIKFLEERS